MTIYTDNGLLQQDNVAKIGLRSIPETSEKSCGYHIHLIGAQLSIYGM